MRATRNWKNSKYWWLKFLLHTRAPFFLIRSGDCLPPSVAPRTPACCWLLRRPAKKKPQIVSDSMKEFSKDRYGVDVLKVEVPINMKYVEGAKSYGGQKAYTR